jgi:hypothetical protein
MELVCSGATALRRPTAGTAGGSGMRPDHTVSRRTAAPLRVNVAPRGMFMYPPATEKTE